jgi:hypothetical protein
LHAEEPAALAQKASAWVGEGAELAVQHVDHWLSKAIWVDDRQSTVAPGAIAAIKKIAAKYRMPCSLLINTRDSLTQASSP